MNFIRTTQKKGEIILKEIGNFFKTKTIKSMFLRRIQHNTSLVESKTKKIYFF